MSREPKKADLLTVSIYSVLAFAGLYVSAALGACTDMAVNEEKRLDIDSLTGSLDSTLTDTGLVISSVLDGGYALKFPIFAAFGIGIYALMKITGKKRFHRRGEEYGSARWARKKEILSLSDSRGNSKRRKRRNVKKGEEHRQEDYTPDNNIILTRDVKMALDTRKTRKNLNVLVVGSSGSGKSRFFVKPNLMQVNTSFVCTDPKGELLRSTGTMLEKFGYRVRVLNLIDMKHSNNYNPFSYIYDSDGSYSASAVIKMVMVLMKNTKKEGTGGGDQFWEDSTKALFSALCFYLVECEDRQKQNFGEVMKLLKKAEVKEGAGDIQSDLDIIFSALEKNEGGNADERKRDNDEKTSDTKTEEGTERQYMCLKYYKDFKKAAGDTAKSILISAAVRLQAFNIPEIVDLTSCDNICLDTIGDEKTALFIIIPPSDDTFNFLGAMMYTQLFDVLYERANFRYEGFLPVHVRCLLDEFANIGEIPRFEELLATMRSMNISADVIIQNLTQLRKMYKDSWENILGNCDSFLFLGGQEPTTLEYISKALGKETIDTVTENRTRGKNGSTTINSGITGRELLTTDELKVLNDNECILFVRGLHPIFSEKYVITEHPNYSLLDDQDPGNVYLLSSIETVKAQVKDERNIPLYSEPVEETAPLDDKDIVKSEESDKKKEISKQSVTLDEIRSIGSQDHTMTVRRKAEEQKKGEKAVIEKGDTIVTGEVRISPKLLNGKGKITLDYDQYDLRNFITEEIKNEKNDDDNEE